MDIVTHPYMKGSLNELRCFPDLLKRIETLEVVTAVKANTSDKLKEGNIRLNNVITKLEARIDEQEQRGRITSYFTVFLKVSSKILTIGL